MPKGFYKHNHQGKKNPFFGKHHSLKSKERMSLAHKGQIPWSKGKRGLWKHTEESKKKMSLASKGKPKSEEHRRKISEIHKGEKYKEIAIRNLGEFAKKKEEI